LVSGLGGDCFRRIVLDTENRTNRRQFLSTVGGGAAAAAFLATQGVANASPENAGYSTAPAQDDAQEIRLLIRDDIKSAYAADAAVELWQSEHAAKVTLDVPPQGADISQRVQAAQASGDLIWDGFSVIEFPSNTMQWITRGLIAPLDEYIAASSIGEAQQVIDGIIPSISESMKYEGQHYGIPGNVGSVALAWMTEPLERVGITEDPVTWEEVYNAAVAIYDGAPEFTPFDAANSPLCDLWSMMWGATDAPIREDGLIDITGEAAIAAIEWQRQMVEEQLMPPVRSQPGTANQNFADWQKGATAIITSFDVAATINQQTFGVDAAKNGLNMRREKDQVRAGTPFWTNGSVVLEGGQNPQGMTDFLLWWFSPSNEATGRQIAEVAAKPCYQYTYDSFVANNPEYQWELDAIEVVRNSVPFRADLTRQIQGEVTQGWLEQAIAGEIDPLEAMESALAEIEEEISKISQ
jgi:ABC-type glycerol-3-phosphate transport system substrate-binding protein